jgi:hypothetical protein
MTRVSIAMLGRATLTPPVRREHLLLGTFRMEKTDVEHLREVRCRTFLAPRTTSEDN